MNLSLVIKSGIEFYAQLWLESAPRNKKTTQIAVVIIGIFLSNSLALGQFSALETAEDLFAKGKYSEALQIYQEIDTNSMAAPVDVSLADCRLGVIYSIKNRQPEAKKYLEKSVNSNLIPRRHLGVCQYALLQIYILDKAYNDAKEFLNTIAAPDLKPIYVARMYALAVEISEATKDKLQTKNYLQKLIKIMEDNQLSEVEIKILGNRKFSLTECKDKLQKENTNNKAISETKKSDLPASRATAIPIATPVDPIQMAQLSKMPTNSSNSKVANSTSNNSEDKDLGMFLDQEKIQNRHAKLASDNPKNMRIGIILPLGNFFTKFNSRILRSISSFASSSAVQGVDFTFFIRNPSNDVGSAEQAANELILDEAVHVIIGPISNQQTLGVIGIANIFSVPVFALGPVVAAPELAFTNLIRMGASAKSQALALIKHVQEDLKFRNASIFAPDDPYGYEMAKMFENVAKERLFPVIQTTFYSGMAAQVNGPVQTAIGPQNQADRQEELDKLIEEGKQKAKDNKQKFNPKSVLLPPILPFDVIYVPESLSKARVIASTFAFYGAQKVKYLGDKQWNEGAVGNKSIADPFMNGSRTTMTVPGAFLSYLKRDIDSSEVSLDLERQAFDALIFVRTAQYKAGGNQGKKLIESLHAKDWSAEGTGLYTGVDENGEVICKYLVQAYRNGKMEAELPKWTLENNLPNK